MYLFTFASPFIFDLFGKAHQVFDLKHRAVVQHSLAVEMTEHLVLIAFDEFEGGQGRAVELGDEIGGEPAVEARARARGRS